MKCFSEDITASSTSILFGINRNTINSYYNEFRELLLDYSLKITGREFGEFELDESYFGAKQIRGKRGRVSACKMQVFGLLK
ncbi:MAG: hypothetical protein K2N11_04260 [Mucispirillum sp.]|nr:hypothetical protein [Mucispirillum sp.]